MLINVIIVKSSVGKPIDRALLRSSQILTRTFTHNKGGDSDLDYLVNPMQSDYNKPDVEVRILLTPGKGN